MEDKEDAIDIENLAASISDEDGGLGSTLGEEKTPLSAEIPADGSAFSAEESPVESTTQTEDTDALSADKIGLPESGDSSSSGGDIEDLIKKYEELPDKSAKKTAPEKVKSKAGKGKKIPVIPAVSAAALSAVILIAVGIKVLMPKSPPVAKIRRATSLQTQAPALQAENAPPVREALLSQEPFLYPGAVALSSGTKDGIETKFFETASSLRDIKLFYQKRAAENGFEITSSRINNKTFNMNFAKGGASLNVSVVPHTAGKNVVVVSKSK